MLPLDPQKGSGNTTGIFQPNGVLTYNDLLFVVNQNALQPQNGAVLAYHLPRGITISMYDKKRVPLPEFMQQYSTFGSEIFKSYRSVSKSHPAQQPSSLSIPFGESEFW